MTFAIRATAIAVSALLAGCAASLSPYIARTPVWTADFDAETASLAACTLRRLQPSFGPGLQPEGEGDPTAISYLPGSFQVSTLRFQEIAPGRTRVALTTDLLRSRRLAPEDVLSPIQVCASQARRPALRRKG